jgi:hypothetical protein
MTSLGSLETEELVPDSAAVGWPARPPQSIRVGWLRSLDGASATQWSSAPPTRLFQENNAAIACHVCLW